MENLFWMFIAISYLCYLFYTVGKVSGKTGLSFWQAAKYVEPKKAPTND